MFDIHKWENLLVWTKKNFVPLVTGCIIGLVAHLYIIPSNILPSSNCPRPQIFAENESIKEQNAWVSPDEEISVGVHKIDGDKVHIWISVRGNGKEEVVKSGTQVIRKTPQNVYQISIREIDSQDGFVRIRVTGKALENGNYIF